MPMATINLTKRLHALEKKVAHLTNMVEDLTITPAQLAKLKSVNSAVASGSHKRWKTLDSLIGR